MYIENNFKYENDRKTVLIECLDKTITHFKADESLMIIEENAFKDCIYLKEIEFPKEIILHKNSFNVPNIEKITIGNNHSNLDKAINTSTLKELIITGDLVNTPLFYIESENVAPNLEKMVFKNHDGFVPKEDVNFSVDGVFYANDSNETILLYYPPGKKDEIFNVPTFVDIIFPDTFYYNPYIKQINFPDKEIEFCNDIINNCPNLEAVVLNDIPKDVTFFKNCDNLNIMAVQDPKGKSFRNLNIISKDDIIFNRAKTFKDLNNFYKTNR